MYMSLPELSLVVLAGPSGSGKSTFARAHFQPTEVLSSDVCRRLVAGAENGQTAAEDAFDVLYHIAGKRLARRRLTVVDATNGNPEEGQRLVELARELHVPAVVIVLDLPPKLCHERNAARPDRGFGAHGVHQQSQQLRRSLRGLNREGFRHVTILRSPEEVAAVAIERVPSWADRGADHGPFDVIGASPPAPLSGRELEVLALFARKLANKEVAGRLGISVGTVKRHAHNVYEKLGLSGRHQAVARALKLGLLLYP